MKNIKLAFLNIKKNLRNAKELKSAFITSIIGMCINNVSFIFLWYNFGTMIGNINGWEPYDIFGLYGFSTTSFGLVCSFFYGIFNIPRYISTANFDKYLSTPKNTLLKVVTSDISTSAIGDLIFGIICFLIFAFVSKLSFLQIIVSIILILVASMIFFSFSLISMSISFYLMDGENISSGIYGMFLSASLYHGGAFTGVLKAIFVFIVPSLLIGSVPVEIIKNLSLKNISLIILLATFWLVISVLFFYKSLKKYESNNFFGYSG
ncbi:MAG: ABC-2 family transporter protein [Bacilli bacterium]|nr:ABC-2 family transporter protein [Bacilli bacterium]